MDREDLRTVKVYTEKYSTKDKQGNIVEKELEKKQVCLKKEDPFENDDLVVVLSYDDYIKLNESLNSEIIQKDEKISKLEKQLSSLKNSFFNNVADMENKLDDKDKLIESQNKILDLNQKLSNVEEERAAIFKELDYKNKMILAYNVELNKSILKAIDVVIDEARDNINNRNKKLVDELEKSISKSKSEVNEKNKAIAYDIDSTVDSINEEIKNTSTLKMILNKNKINLKVPTDDLLKPFEFDVDPGHLFDGQSLELDASEILKEVMPKLPEPFSKYMDTLERKEDVNTIDVKEKKKIN